MRENCSVCRLVELEAFSYLQLGRFLCGLHQDISHSGMTVSFITVVCYHHRHCCCVFIINRTHCRAGRCDSSCKLPVGHCSLSSLLLRRSTYVCQKALINAALLYFLPCLILSRLCSCHSSNVYQRFGHIHPYSKVGLLTVFKPKPKLRFSARTEQNRNCNFLWA